MLSAIGVKGEFPMPDISTKAKAQEYIGLDMKTLHANKDKFKSEIIPQWVAKAKENKRLL